MNGDKLYPRESIASIEEAERLIREVYGDVELTHEYCWQNGLHLWFIGQPDEYYQNYIAQMGKARLVINEKKE
jgi:hypothetical protein